MSLVVIIVVVLFLSPWLLRFARLIFSSPEAIGTIGWMSTTCCLFIFAGPLLSALVGFDRHGGHEQTLFQIAFTLVAFWLTAAATYRAARFLLSVGKHTYAIQANTNAMAMIRAAAMQVRPAYVFPVFAFISALQFWLIRTQGVGISGGAGKGATIMVELPYHLVILFMLVSGAGIPFAAVFARWATVGNSSVLVKAMAVAGLLCSLVLGITAGRRELLYTLIMVAFGILWGGRRRGALVFTVLGAVAFGVLTVISPIFLEARLIYSQRNSPGVVEAFSIAYEKWQTSNLEVEQASKNVEWRLNTLGSWISIYESVEPGKMNGLILTQAALLTIPRALVGFSKYKYGAVEDAMLAGTDISNSVPLESTLDLGFSGPFVYGIIFGITFALVDLMIMWIGQSSLLLAVIASGTMIPVLISPEANPQTYFSVLRQVVIYSIVALPIRFISPSFVRPASAAARYVDALRKQTGFRASRFSASRRGQ
jgi:hypothetical protein